MHTNTISRNFNFKLIDNYVSGIIMFLTQVFVTLKRQFAESPIPITDIGANCEFQQCPHVTYRLGRADRSFVEEAGSALWQIRNAHTALIHAVRSGLPEACKADIVSTCQRLTKTPALADSPDSPVMAADRGSPPFKIFGLVHLLRAHPRSCDD